MIASERKYPIAEYSPMGLQEFVLDNGLRVIPYVLPYRNGVSINARVCAGSAASPNLASGVAHLLEHVMLQGTHSRPTNFDLTAPVEALGGELSAYTHAEYTSFWVEAPQPAVDLALDILLDLVRNAAIDPEKVAGEKAVITDEIAEYYELGLDHGLLLLDRALWGNHPLGRPVFGSPEALMNMGATDLRSFMDDHYAPNNIVLTIVGDLDPKEMVESVELRWRDWLARPTPPPLPEPPASANRLVFKEREGDLVHLVLGFKVSALNHPDQAAYQVLRTLLGEGMSSRLHTSLRGEVGLAYTVECTYDELRHACVLGIYLAVQPSRALKTFRRVLDVLRDIRTGQISPEEASRARSATAGRLTVKADIPSTHARHICLSSALTGEANSLDHFIAEIRDVQWGDVCRCGAVVGAPENLHVAAVGPIDERLLKAIEFEVEER